MRQGDAQAGISERPRPPVDELVAAAAELPDGAGFIT